MSWKRRLFRFIGSLIPERIFLFRMSGMPNDIFLTFDDGPVPGVTNRILDILDRHDAKATFFVIGRHAEEHPDLVREIVRRGHRLGNHSFHHRRFRDLPLTEAAAEIRRTGDLIRDVTGQEVRLFRAPQGKWSPGMLWYLYRNGITATHWSRDSMDSRQQGADDIVEEFRSRPVRPGDIILFHDDDEKSAAALETLLPYWKRQGLNMPILETR